MKKIDLNLTQSSNKLYLHKGEIGHFAKVPLLKMITKSAYNHHFQNVISVKFSLKALFI